jgi:hypothetical protein
MNEHFKYVRSISEKVGYQVLNGLKAFKAPLTTERYDELLKSSDEEIKEGVKIFNKDLIYYATLTDFIDFRQKRILIDFLKFNKQILYRQEKEVLFALIRMMVFESSHLISNP